MTEKIDLSDMISSFEENLRESKSKRIYHYQSVLNIGKSLQKYNDEKTNEFKDQLLSYLQIVEENKYEPISKRDSSQYFSEYLFPSFLFLVNKEQFRAKSTVKSFFVIGLIIDLILYFITQWYYYPIFTIVLFLISYSRNMDAKKEKRFASMFY